MTLDGALVLRGSWRTHLERHQAPGAKRPTFRPKVEHPSLEDWKTPPAPSPPRATSTPAGRCGSTPEAAPRASSSRSVTRRCRPRSRPAWPGASSWRRPRAPRAATSGRWRTSPSRPATTRPRRSHSFGRRLPPPMEASPGGDPWPEGRARRVEAAAGSGRSALAGLTAPGAWLKASACVRPARGVQAVARARFRDEVPDLMRQPATGRLVSAGVTRAPRGARRADGRALRRRGGRLHRCRSVKTSFKTPSSSVWAASVS
jgi:hypothetical protein